MAYQDTRMDTVWAVRQAYVWRTTNVLGPSLIQRFHSYDKAREYKNAQDNFCEKALAGDWRSLGGQKFPESLQWQPLVDILRGRIKVSKQETGYLHETYVLTICPTVGSNALLRSA